mmetsp:Transcript_47185/g.121970  ORF Transcript_47185/g.121970 Transcript_47185/m.121970 type:complete len:249 (-) Transcript_47185:1250-1996(-)
MRICLSKSCTVWRARPPAFVIAMRVEWSSRSNDRLIVSEWRSSRIGVVDVACPLPFSSSAGSTGAPPEFFFTTLNILFLLAVGASPPAPSFFFFKHRPLLSLSILSFVFRTMEIRFCTQSQSAPRRNLSFFSVSAVRSISASMFLIARDSINLCAGEMAFIFILDMMLSVVDPLTIRVNTTIPATTKRVFWRTRPSMQGSFSTMRARMRPTAPLKPPQVRTTAPCQSSPYPVRRRRGYKMRIERALIA